MLYISAKKLYILKRPQSLVEKTKWSLENTQPFSSVWLSLLCSSLSTHWLQTPDMKWAHQGMRNNRTLYPSRTFTWTALTTSCCPWRITMEGNGRNSKRCLHGLLGNLTWTPGIKLPLKTGSEMGKWGQYSRKEREEGGKKTLNIYEKAAGNHTIFIYLKLQMIYLSIHVCIHTHNLIEILLLGLIMFPLSHGLLSKNQ